MRFILFFIATLLPSFSYAQEQESKIFISAAYLHEICKRNEEGGEVIKGGHTACQAYIAGVIDYHNLLHTLGTAPSIDICLTNKANMNDLQDVVWTYLDKNAQHDAFAAAPAVTMALNKVFKCKGRK